VRKLALVLLFALTVRSVQAQCIVGRPLEVSLRDDRIKAVFIGTVRDLIPAPTGQVATFNVDRVWHGQVSTSIVVYNKIEGSESKELEVAERYLVIAYTLSSRDQSVAIAADARVTLGVGGCSFHPADAKEVQQILRGAPGYLPSQKP
jgi:hypothetical protein